MENDFSCIRDILRKPVEEAQNLVALWNRHNETQMLLQFEPAEIWFDWQHYDTRRHAVKLVLRRQDGTFVLKNNALQKEETVLRRQVWTSKDGSTRRYRFNAFEPHVVINTERDLKYTEHRTVDFPCLWVNVGVPMLPPDDCLENPADDFEDTMQILDSLSKSGNTCASFSALFDEAAQSAF